MTTETGVRLGDQIQGFIRTLTDHNIKAVRHGDAYHLMLDITGREEDDIFVASVESPQELEDLVKHYDFEGWPTAGSLTKAKAPKPGGWTPPDWVHSHPAIIPEGRGSFVDTPAGETLTTIIISAIQGVGQVNLLGLADELHRLYPRSTFNYKSLSACISVASKEGLISKPTAGVYRYAGPKQALLPPDSDVEFSLLSLLSMGTKWQIVGRMEDGTPVYTVGDDGTLWRVRVEVEQL